MGTTEIQQPIEGQGGGAHPPAGSDPPAMALRTYLCLRLSAVGVIAVLAASLLKEFYRNDPNCLQGSISAFYYTAVQSVFVGALVTLGVIMIVLWGRTAWEDGALNLAGLVAPVVAFVPTAKPNTCGLVTTAGNEVTSGRQTAQVVDASRDGIFNNMLAYLIVVGAVLVLLTVVGVIAYPKHWDFVTKAPVAYWAPLAVAWILGAVGGNAFWHHREWFYANAHKWSAVMLFALIITVVVDIGTQKWPPGDRGFGKLLEWWRGLTHSDRDPDPSKAYAFVYWAVAAVMVLGAIVVFALVGKAHHTFAVEAWMIGWFAIFWLVQTWDRRGQGAPRSPAEKPEIAADPPAQTM